MKKIAPILVLLLALSFSAFADEGTTHTGGKSCPQVQTCLLDGEIPFGGKSDDPIINTIFDYLKSIFG